MERRYLSIDELSQYLGVTKGTLYAWVCRKRIPYLKIGRLVKFDKTKIDAWAMENAVEVAV